MSMFTILKKSAIQFSEDRCTTLAASLAYYTLFAMPPLLYLLVMVLSVGMSASLESDAAREQAQVFVQQQAANLIGNEAAAAEVGKIVEHVSSRSGSWWKATLSLIGVVVGATGLVAALQAALNQVWKVRPAPGSFAIHFLLKRVFSLAMILGFGFLLLVSFMLSTALAIMGDYASQLIAIGGIMPIVVNHTVSFLTTWAFFTGVLRIMPDAHVTWRHAAVGGLVTVLLFTAGRVALYYYLLLSNPGGQLGSAAASLVVILMWVYYSAISLLLGAEFTANLAPGDSKPEPGAVQADAVGRAQDA